LREVFKNGRNASARADMALASVFGGLALSNAGLGAVHGLAGPMGGLFPAPHGALCAALLPHAMEINLRALQERQPDSESLLRYETVARLLTGNTTTSAEDGIAWVSKLVADLQIPALRTYGVTLAEAPEIISRGAKSSSIKANPISLTAAELTEIISRSL
jgi:alcohol dehydrogenase class IV